MKDCLYCKNRGIDHVCKSCVAWNRYEDINYYTIVNENTPTSRRRPDKELYRISTALNTAFGSGLCIKKVIFNNPATIVLWTDGAKTVVKCDGEKYDPEKGLAMAICKKSLGNNGNYYKVFKKWMPKDESDEIS